MKNKTFIFENESNILTTGNLITEGKRYTYKEGSRIGKIIVKEVIPDPEFLRVRVNFYEVGKIIEVSHRKDLTGGYMGMWRIYDESFYEEHRKDYYTVEQKMAPPAFTPSVTKAGYIKSLNRDQNDLLLGYFNSIYDCPELGENELNITYIAWLVGEGQVMLSSEFTINDMDVEFNEDDYEISFEDGKLQVGIDVELTRYFYDLDRIHTILVLSR